MSDEVNQRKVNIGAKILETARGRLYMAMRFMDMALCAFTYEPNDGNGFIGTDGNVIYFYPDYVIDRYEREPRLMNRIYLHVTLHCVYRHIFRLGDRNKRLWNLACDVAVEHIIDGFNYTCIKMRLPAERDLFYGKITKNIEILTADLIYKYLVENKYDENEDELTALENEFLVDDHNYWYHNSDNRSMQNQTQQKWDDISKKMQTSMETVEKNAGNENSGLYRSVKVENKKRYDYKNFLRKFAVYNEEMSVDPDEFDYIFYMYGLEHYGNMPLIEPLETREVKKIQDFVIVIDTSFSCSEELVKNFLQETCQILMESESFFKKVHIRILQCDVKVQKDDLVTNKKEMEDYINHLEIAGRGGTDFRPAFEYVDALLNKGEFSKLRGLIYFTDGKGEYPKSRQPYDTAFVFLKEDYDSARVPAWAMKLEI